MKYDLAEPTQKEFEHNKLTAFLSGVQVWLERGYSFEDALIKHNNILLFLGSNQLVQDSLAYDRVVSTKVLANKYKKILNEV